MSSSKYCTQKTTISEESWNPSIQEPRTTSKNLVLPGYAALDADAMRLGDYRSRVPGGVAITRKAAESGPAV